MKKVNGLLTAVAAFSAVVFSGCVTQRPIPVEVVVVQESPAVQAPAPVAEPVPAPVAESAPVQEQPKPVTDTVTVSVAASGATGATFAADIAVRLREELTKRGYRFIDGNVPYAGLTLSASSSVKARLDEWFVCDGQVDARIAFAAADGTETVDKRFVVQGPRKLGRADAEKVLVAPLACAIADWLDQNVKGRK